MFKKITYGLKKKKHFGNSTQRISKKITNSNYSFLISQTHPCESHSPSQIYSLVFLSTPKLFINFFLSHLTVYALSPVFSSSSYFFLSQNAATSSCLSIYFHLLCLYIHKPNSSYSHLFTFCFPSNIASASSFLIFFFHFCILAKSLILASIDWNARNGLKFHMRWNRRVVVPVCMQVRDFPTGTKWNP